MTICKNFKNHDGLSACISIDKYSTLYDLMIYVADENNMQICTSFYGYYLTEKKAYKAMQAWSRRNYYSRFHRS